MRVCGLILHALMVWFPIPCHGLHVLVHCFLPPQAAGRKKWGHLPQYTHYMENTNAIVLGPPAEPLPSAMGSAVPK